MGRKNWKKVQPNSLRQAMEWCKDYAREKHHLSVERIAERMGEADHWVLYKWINTGRIPAVLIPAYETACGIDFVSRWLSIRNNKLVVDMPTGRNLKPSDVHQLQEQLHEVVGQLISFYRGDAEAEVTLAAITHSMEALAWHKGNVAHHQHPQLELGDSDE